MSCKSKAYCPYPFIGVSLQADGMTLPCGQYMDVSKFPKTQTIQEARNNYMQVMREKMLNGEHDAGCQCPAEEATGIKSMRQSAIDRYGIQPYSKVKVAEIFFDNVCNLKCRMCASPYSHLIYEDEKKIYGETISPTKYVKNTNYLNLDTTELEEVKVYGGEPLLNKEANEFFGKIIQDGNIENLSIDISTNGTILPMSNVLDAFLRCKELKINISIDGYKELNEYIRSGSNWNEIDENLKFFDSLFDRRNKHTLIQIHSAVGIYNANKINELDQYIENTFPRFSKTKQMIQYPVFLNIQNAPKEYKDLISPLLDSDMRQYMYNSKNDYFSHFVNYHTSMNRIRCEELESKNSLLHDFINEYNTATIATDSSKFFIDQIKFLKGEKNEI